MQDTAKDAAQGNVETVCLGRGANLYVKMNASIPVINYELVMNSKTSLNLCFRNRRKAR